MPSIRDHPATVTAFTVAVLVILYTLLTSTNVFLGLIFAASLLGIGLLLDRLSVSMRSPSEYRVTILVVPIVTVLGVYMLLTPTNVLLWFVAAGVLLGIGLGVDVLLSG